MTSEISRHIQDDHPAERSLEVDFALVLSRTIDSIEHDPVQLRNAVYQLARVKLQNEVCGMNPPLSVEEVRHLRRALESAIRGVETFAKKEHNAQLEYAGVGLNADQDSRRHSSATGRVTALSIGHQTVAGTEKIAFVDAPAPARHRPKFNIRRLRYALATVTLAIALSVLFVRHFGFVTSRESTERSPAMTESIVQASEPRSAVEQAASPKFGLDGSAALSQWSGLPRPTAYGVYAISNGRLNELDVLPIRVPDGKVRVSAPINKQSGTTLPDGRIVFIVFRRDFTNLAPERVSIRVVARVVRALSFDPQGKGTNSSLEDMWTIRNISYDFRVAPLIENGEMFVIRPEDANFSFPAGRHALALKGQAYDFTVAGVVTETAQCIERVEAVNGTFYAECRRQ
jgi:hypothetical protein